MFFGLDDATLPASVTAGKSGGQSTRTRSRECPAVTVLPFRLMLLLAIEDVPGEDGMDGNRGEHLNSVVVFLWGLPSFFSSYRSISITGPL